MICILLHPLSFFFLTVILIVSLFLSFQSMMTRKSGLVVNFGVGELCIFVVLKFMVAVNQHFITYLNCCSRMSHKKSRNGYLFGPTLHQNCPSFQGTQGSRSMIPTLVLCPWSKCRER